MDVLQPPTLIKSWAFDYDPNFEVFVPIIHPSKSPIVITHDTRPLVFRTLALNNELRNDRTLLPGLPDGNCPPIERGSTTGRVPGCPGGSKPRPS
jgi:hypothetical protein